MDDLEKIQSTDITTVKSVFVAYLKKHYIFLIVLPSLLILIGLWLAYKTKVPHFLFIPFFLDSAIYAILWQKLIGDFLEHFARDIGYSFSKKGDISSVDATIFNYGSEQRISRIVSGKYFGKDSRLFVFSTTVGSGKHRHTILYSVLEITFDAMLPNILLNNKKNWLAFLNDEKKLKLEGDFQNYFSLYVVKEYEIEALQIFTPKTMQMFIEKAGKISVEMYKNKVYLYYSSEITKKDELVSIYGLAKEIILRLDRTFTAITDDVEDMAKYAKLT